MYQNEYLASLLFVIYDTFNNLINKIRLLKLILIISTTNKIQLEFNKFNKEIIIE